MNHRAPNSGKRTPLSAKVAFIVHLTSTEQLAGTLTGRVEHVTSGCSLRFTSTTQLVDFMERTVTRQEEKA